MATNAVPHGLPIQVTTTTDGESLAIAGSIPLAELIDDGFEIGTEDPGIGVGFASSGPPLDTRIGIETAGGLMYWDGALASPGDVWLTIEAPEFDSLANPTEAAVGEYLIDESTAVQSGMTWANYPAASFWDAHGYFLLGSSHGVPAAGVYGVALRLVDLRSATPLGPSEPFVFMLRFDPAGSFSDADVLAAQSAFSALLAIPGDYDGDGSVGPADYDAWQAQFGGEVLPGSGADGNADGLVDIADYTVWRDALGTAQGAAVPEPTMLVVSLFCSCTLVASPRRRATYDVTNDSTANEVATR